MVPRNLAVIFVMLVVTISLQGCKQPKTFPTPRVIITDKTESNQWEDWGNRRGHTYDFIVDASIQNNNFYEIIPSSITANVIIDGTSYQLDGHGEGEWKTSLYLPKAYCDANLLIGTRFVMEYSFRGTGEQGGPIGEFTSKTELNKNINVTKGDPVVVQGGTILGLSNQIGSNLITYVDSDGEWGGDFYIFNWTPFDVYITGIEISGSNPTMEIKSKKPSLSDPIIINDYLTGDWCNSFQVPDPPPSWTKVRVKCSEDSRSISEEFKIFWTDDFGASQSITTNFTCFTIDE